jgi:hypothetical protein
MVGLLKFIAIFITVVSRYIYNRWWMGRIVPIDRHPPLLSQLTDGSFSPICLRHRFLVLDYWRVYSWHRLRNSRSYGGQSCATKIVLLTLESLFISVYVYAYIVYMIIVVVALTLISIVPLVGSVHAIDTECDSYAPWECEEFIEERCNGNETRCTELYADCPVPSYGKSHDLLLRSWCVDLPIMP